VPVATDALAPEPLGSVLRAALDDVKVPTATNPLRKRVTSVGLQLFGGRIATATEFERHTKVAAMGRVLWERVVIEPVCTIAGHEAPCLALAFVPALVATLVWLEARVRVHVADVRCPGLAHQVVHLHVLPAQIALANDSAAGHAPATDASTSSTAVGTSEVAPPVATRTEVDLKDAAMLVLNAWRVGNSTEKHMVLYDPAVRMPGLFPTYNALVAALWGTDEPGGRAGREQDVPQEFKEFVAAVLRAENVRIKPHSRAQEAAYTVCAPRTDTDVA
jgi:hypothetical protein